MEPINFTPLLVALFCVGVLSGLLVGSLVWLLA